MTKTVVKISAWSFIIGSAAAIADRIDFGEFGWFFDLSAQFTLHLVFAGVVVSIALLLFRSTKLLSAALFLSGAHIFSVVSQSNFSLPRSGSSQSAETVSVLSANIWRNANALDQLAELAELEDTDIVAIVEMTRNSCNDLAEDFPQYPFCRIVDRNEQGALLSKSMALLSKNEPQSFSVLSQPEFRNRGIISAVFEFDSRLAQVVVVHPVAPGSPAHMRDRNHVLSATNALLEHREHFMLMGDMNTTPWSRVGRRLPGVRAGDPRTESTWLTRFPLIGLPIDHIRFSDSLRLNDYRLGPNIGSDHMPLIAEFQFDDAKTQPKNVSLGAE
ncbi:MAG: endonuclease/exonuclease/phosphatase family protein [Pseudomonadota bacterium]